METKENSSSLAFEQRACITKKEKKLKKKREKKQKAKREKAKKKKKIKLMFIPAGVCVFRWIYEYLESLSNKHAFLMQKQ